MAQLQRIEAQRPTEVPLKNTYRREPTARLQKRARREEDMSNKKDLNGII